MEESKNRLAYIDGLRGIAALTVVLSHFLCAFYPAFETALPSDIHTKSGYEVLIAQSPLNVLYSGNFAVCVFFVISGYVLSHSFFVTGNNETIISSAIRRYPRLIIPALVSVLLSYLLYQLHLYGHQETAGYSHSLWLAEQWTLVPDFTGLLKNVLYDLPVKRDPVIAYNPALWTIGFELKGSLLVYVFLLLFGKLKNRRIFYLVFFLVFLKSYYVLFIVGILLCDLSVKKHKTFGPAVVSGMVLLALYLGSYRNNADGNTWKWLDAIASYVEPKAIGAILLLFAFTRSQKMKTVFSKKIFVFLGNISYSVYLLHLIVIGSFSCTFFNWLYGIVHVSYCSSFVITFLTSLLMILVTSKLMYEQADKRGAAWSHYLYRKLFKQH